MPAPHRVHIRVAEAAGIHRRSACGAALPFALPRRELMTWTKPQYQDFRFGFEITMYVKNR